LNVKEDISQNDTSEDIEQKIYEYIQYISLQACFGIFTQLIFSVGTKEFREIYLDVAETIGTPAAKIISFSTNSYYGKLDMKELENLCKELEKNPVALRILRARVRAYIYNNYIDYKDKQKIASRLNMRISPTSGRENKGH